MAEIEVVLFALPVVVPLMDIFWGRGGANVTIGLSLTIASFLCMYEVGEFLTNNILLWCDAFIDLLCGIILKIEPTI